MKEMDIKFMDPKCEPKVMTHKRKRMALLLRLKQEMTDLSTGIILLLQRSRASVPMGTVAQMVALQSALAVSRRMAPDNFPKELEAVRLALGEAVSAFQDMMVSSPDMFLSEYVPEPPAGPDAPAFRD